MANLVVHFEIHASEPQVLIDFYSELFGWSFTRYGEMDYWGIDTGEGAVGSAEGRPGHGINGGLVPRPNPRPEIGAPINGADLVIGVDGSIDELYAKGIALGATVAMALDDMAGVGRLGYLIDPDGNVFGMISPTLSDGTSAMG